MMETRQSQRLAVYDPSQKQIIGRRTGKVIEIRNGMKSVDDIFSDSDADATLDVTRHNISNDIEVEPSALSKSIICGKSKHESRKFLLPNEKTSAVASRKPTRWRFGRRTGIDVFAGKNKLINNDGIGSVSDFFSDTDTSMSLHPTPDRNLSSASMASDEASDSSSQRLRSSQKRKTKNRSSNFINVSKDYVELVQAKENENSAEVTKVNSPLSFQPNIYDKSKRRTSLLNTVQTESNLPLTNTVNQSCNQSSNKSFQSDQRLSTILPTVVNDACDLLVTVDVHPSEQFYRENQMRSLNSSHHSNNDETYPGKENHEPISDNPTRGGELVEDEIQQDIRPEEQIVETEGCKQQEDIPEPERTEEDSSYLENTRLSESKAPNQCDTSCVPLDQCQTEAAAAELRQTPVELLPSTSVQPPLDFGGTTTGSVSNTDKVLANQCFGIKKRLTFGSIRDDEKTITDSGSDEVSIRRRKSCPKSFLDYHTKDKSAFPVSNTFSVETDATGESSDNFCIVPIANTSHVQHIEIKEQAQNSSATGIKKRRLSSGKKETGKLSKCNRPSIDELHAKPSLKKDTGAGSSEGDELCIVAAKNLDGNKIVDDKHQTNRKRIRLSQRSVAKNVDVSIPNVGNANRDEDFNECPEDVTQQDNDVAMQASFQMQLVEEHIESESDQILKSGERRKSETNEVIWEKPTAGKKTKLKRGGKNVDQDKGSSDENIKNNLEFTKSRSPGVKKTNIPHFSLSDDGENYIVEDVTQKNKDIAMQPTLHTHLVEVHAESESDQVRRNEEQRKAESNEVTLKKSTVGKKTKLKRGRKNVDQVKGSSDENTKNNLESTKSCSPGAKKTDMLHFSLSEGAEDENYIAGNLMNSVNVASSEKTKKIVSHDSRRQLSIHKKKSGRNSRSLVTSPDRSRRSSKRLKPDNRKSHKKMNETATPVRLNPLMMLPKVTPMSGISFRRKSSFVPNNGSSIIQPGVNDSDCDMDNDGTPLRLNSKTTVANLRTKSRFVKKTILQEDDNRTSELHEVEIDNNDLNEENQKVPDRLTNSRKSISMRKRAILQNAHNKGLKVVAGTPHIEFYQPRILNSPSAAHDDSTVLPSPSSTPVHYAETTMSEKRRSNMLTLPDLSYKIIQPELDKPGLRRSKRTRVQRLNSYKGEGIIYRRDSSGFGLIVEGIQPSLGEAKLIQIDRERHSKMRKRKLQANAVPAKSKRISTHWSVQHEVTDSSDITVINPETDEHVVLELVSRNRNASWVGPDLTPVTARDPLSLCMLLNQPSFGTGELHIRPLCQKSEQTTIQTVVYFVLHGKVCVTLNNTSFIVESRDDFFIPRGTSYKIKNLRRDIAQLKFLNFYDSSMNITRSSSSSS